MSQKVIDKIIGQVNGIKESDVIYQDALILQNSDRSFSKENSDYTDMRYNESAYRNISTKSDTDLEVLIDSKSPKVIDALKDLVGRKFPNVKFVDYEKLTDSVLIKVSEDTPAVRLLDIQRDSENKFKLPLSVFNYYLRWYLNQDGGIYWNRF